MQLSIKSLLMACLWIMIFSEKNCSSNENELQHQLYQLLFSHVIQFSVDRFWFCFSRGL